MTSSHKQPHLESHPCCFSNQFFCMRQREMLENHAHELQKERSNLPFTCVLIMQLNSRHEHRAIEDYMRSRFGPRLATAGATPATGAAVSSKAFSFNHSWITFRGFCNQWSELKAPRFSADKSKVATTARLHNVYNLNMQANT